MPSSVKNLLPWIVGISAIVVAAGLLLVAGDNPQAARWLAGCALVFTVPAFGLPYLTAGRDDDDRQPPLVGNVVNGRNDIINAMSILQQEIRLLQDARKGEGDFAPLRDEVARLASEINALKSAMRTAEPAPVKPAGARLAATRKPAVEEAPVADEPEEVAPMSFDEEPPPAPKRVATTPPRAAAPAPAPAPAPKAAAKPAPQPEPLFEEPEAVDETGLQPEEMEEEGDWLTGGLEEKDLVVNTQVDFEAIVQKDALRPKPTVNPEEQRVLREEMEQMADSDDWVGGGLQDRDVKVRKTTVNDALFDKFRAEIEAKRQAREAVTGVRAPARGDTALLANVTVPTGARLFVRGVGPGLSVDRGTPMQQSGHGKWQWIAAEPGKACVITIWENDQTQAEGNPIRVPAGFALTVTPTFRRKVRL